MQAIGSRPLVQSHERLGVVLFLGLVLFQGFHELEHVVQIIQRFVLGIPTGNGLLGSVADVEPVHLVYNGVFLALLIGTYLLLGLHQAGARRFGVLVFGLLTFAVLWQSWHTVEHVAKIVQYVALGMRNGTGGVLGAGPGGLLPLFNIPWLHFVYNTVVYIPVLIAFFAVRGPERVKAILQGSAR